MKSFVTVICCYIMLVINAAGSYLDINAENFCTNNPSLNLCQIFTSSRHRQIRNPSGFLGGASDEFCDNNQDQFGYSCNDRFTDSGQNDFCSNYGVRCRGWKKFDQSRQVTQTVPTQLNPVPQPQNSVAQANSQVQHQSDVYHPLPPKVGPYSQQPQGNVAYCQSYGRDYYFLCLKGPVPDFSAQFCDGFSRTCPGVPEPGTYVGTPPKRYTPRTSPQRTPSSIHSDPNWGYSNTHWRPYAGPQALPSTNPIMPALPVIPSSPQAPILVPASSNQPLSVLPAVPSSQGLPSLPTSGIPVIPSNPFHSSI